MNTDEVPMCRPWLVLTMLMLLCGCRDECSRSRDPDFCDGNTIVTCPEVLDQVTAIRWQRRDCGAQTCVQTDAGATCAESMTPSALCDGGSGSLCDGPALVQCWSGFESRRTVCASCDARVLRAQSCSGANGSRCTRAEDCLSQRCGDGGVCSEP